MGNHEDMLISYIEKGYKTWQLNGNDPTIASYRGDVDSFWSDFRWIKGLPLYYEDNYFVYVHAGIDSNIPMEAQDRNTLLWIREPFIFDDKRYYKKVVFGHTPTIMLNNGIMPVYTKTGNICIDTGCVFGGNLTALIIEGQDVKEFYSIKKEEKDNDYQYYG